MTDVECFNVTGCAWLEKEAAGDGTDAGDSSFACIVGEQGEGQFIASFAIFACSSL